MSKQVLGFRPTGARVLVEKYKEEKKEEYTTLGGLYVPKKEDANLQFKRNSGKILALGTDLSFAGNQHLSVGTIITFKNPHTVSSPDGTEYYIVHENNIDLIVDEL